MAGWDELVRHALQACTELGKDYLSSEIRRRGMHPSAYNLSPSSPAIEEAQGCPYCQVAGSMAIAHRYLHRALARPGLEAVYQALARKHLGEAIFTLEHMGPLTPKGIRLGSWLTKLDRMLSVPPREANYRDIADSIWQATDVALDMAEYNPLENPDIIEAKVRVVK